jgi:hypothetical protein
MSFQCPNCGHVSTETTDYCQQCGARFAGVSRSNRGLRIFFAVILGVVAVGLGAMGACFAAFQVNGPALGAFALAVLCVVGIVMLVK